MPPGPTPEFVLARPRTAPLDPPPAYSRLCEEAPISRVTIWDGRRGAWLVTRWEDARAVLGHPAFSSDPSQPGYPDVQPDQPPQPPGFFANVDAPVHTTMRRTLTREFMVKKIDALRPTITGITGQLLDEIARSQGPVDLVERFALPLPSLVICELLGVPYEDHEYFQERSKVFVDITATGEQSHPASGSSMPICSTCSPPSGGPRRRRPVPPRRAGRRGHRHRGGRHRPGGVPAVRRPRDHREHDRTRHRRPAAEPRRDTPAARGTGRDREAVEELLRYLSIVHIGPAPPCSRGRHDRRCHHLGRGRRDSPHPSGQPRPGGLHRPRPPDLGRANARQHVAFGTASTSVSASPWPAPNSRSPCLNSSGGSPDCGLDAPLEDLAFKQETAVYGVSELPVTW